MAPFLRPLPSQLLVIAKLNNQVQLGLSRYTLH